LLKIRKARGSRPAEIPTFLPKILKFQHKLPFAGRAAGEGVVSRSFLLEESPKRLWGAEGGHAGSPQRGKVPMGFGEQWWEGWRGGACMVRTCTGSRSVTARAIQAAR